MKTSFPYLLLALFCAPAVATDAPLELSPSMALVSQELKPCLADKACSAQLEEILDSEKRFFKMVDKHVKTVPSQMQFGYDVQNMFGALKGGINNRPLSDSARAALQGRYLQDVERVADELIDGKR